MSTTYYISRTDGNEITRKRLAQEAGRLGFYFGQNSDGDDVVAQEKSSGRQNFVHVYFDGGHMYEVTRFGGNDPSWFLDLIKDHFGEEYISEYDDVPFPSDSWGEDINNLV